MVGTFRDWMPAVWAQCWQVTLLILVVWTINRLFARSRPHLASVLWLVVLIKCITPPVWSSPSSVFSWLQSRPSAAVVSEHSLRPRPTQRSSASQTPLHEDVVVRVIHPPEPNSLQQQTRIELPSQSTRWMTWSRSFGLTSPLLACVAIIWLSGGLGFAGYMWLRWIWCWRRLRRAGDLDVPEVVRLTDKLRQQLGLRRPVRIVVSRSPVGPAVVGLLRPTIILPALIVEAKTPEELEPLLAHELVHIRRGDLWVGLLQLVAQGIWWFHPLVRVANRLLTRDAERCCDEEVIARLGCDPARYARTLIDVLALKRTLKPVPAVPGVRPVDVTSQRLERIMKLGQGCHRRTPRWCWAVMFLAAAATLPGAALIVADDVTPPKTAAEATTELAVETAPQNAVQSKSMGPVPVEIKASKASDRNSQQTRVYNVADILQQLQIDTGFDITAAREHLANLVKQAAARAIRHGKIGTMRADKSIEWRADDAEEVVVRQFEATNSLVIRCSEEVHERIQTSLQTMREDGFRQVQIETRIFSGPAANAALIPIDWKVLDLGTPTSRHNIASDEFPNRSREVSSPKDLQKPGSHIHGRVESIIEKRHPTMLALPEPLLLQAIVETAQGDSRTNILQAPRVVLYNGQVATIEDMVSRPFVTGFETVDEQEVRPTIQLFETGWFMLCRPKLKGDTVQLDLNLTLREILSVENTMLSNGKDLPVRNVQVPEVATTRVRTDVLMQSGQTLVIGGLTTLSPDAKRRLPLLIQVSVKKVEPASSATTDATTKSYPNPQPPAVIQQVSGTAVNSAAKDLLRAAAKSEADQKRENIAKEIADLTVQFNDLMQDKRFLAAEAVARSAAKLDPKGATAEVMIWKAEFANRSQKILEHKLRQEAYDSRTKGGSPAATNTTTPAEDDTQSPDLALSTRVYSVADLIVPIEQDVKIQLVGDVTATTPSDSHPDPKLGAGQPNFGPLIEKIQTTVDRNSWAKDGGAADVKAFDATLSIVVRQTEENHRHIAALLTRLRSLQDLQLSFGLQQVEIDVKELEAWVNNHRHTYVKDVLTALQSQQSVMTISSQTEEVLRSAEGVTLTPGVKATVFSGQRIELVTPAARSENFRRVRSVHALPVVSSDLQRIRLNITANRDVQSDANQLAADDTVGKAQLVTVPDGGSLLIDLTEQGWSSSTVSMPVLNKIPYVSRLFKNPDTPAPAKKRYFYLVTPRLLIVPESEMQPIPRL